MSLPAPHVNRCLHPLFYLPQREPSEYFYESSSSEEEEDEEEDVPAKKRPKDTAKPSPPKPSTRTPVAKPVIPTKKKQVVKKTSPLKNKRQEPQPKAAAEMDVSMDNNASPSTRPRRRSTASVSYFPPSPASAESTKSDPDLASNPSGADLADILNRPKRANVMPPPYVKGPVKPRAQDVLFGKGNAINMHPANRRMREWAAELRPRYRLTVRSQRREIAKELLDMVHGQDPPGRFLESHPDGTFTMADEAQAHEKAAQLLRGKKGVKNWVRGDSPYRLQKQSYSRRR